jgi:Mg2+-importing ATPase
LDFERRRVCVLVDGPEGRLLVTKGAPEGMLVCCGSVERNGADGPFYG